MAEPEVQDLRFNELMQEVNHLLAAYRQLLQQVGTAEAGSVLQDLAATRQACLKCCDTAKNYVLPQLRSENLDTAQSSDFINQATQFIGTLNALVAEMKKSQDLLAYFTLLGEPPSSSGEQPSSPRSSSLNTRAQCLSHASSRPEFQSLANDIREAEVILEALENAITVPFDTRGNTEPRTVPVPRARKRGRCGLCVNCKPAYA